MNVYKYIDCVLYVSTLLNKHHIHNDEYVSTFNKANFLFLIKNIWIPN